ncbi:phospholipase D family protein [Limisalsivibrio acetivorans]|uniref:phospholipase D family protein n=1 Tax=Limisalsivibrio acetivorans TaxID=1304888 RepID=UPI0003B688B9|nr:phospholipase D family protein [Limisalsivibrio acetivorans]
MLLGTEKYRNKLSEALNKAEDSITILTAFLTTEGLSWIKERVSSSNIKVKIVTRWRLSDLLTGASSLTAYEEMKVYGWELYADQNLHAKAICIDNSIIFLGSANMTSYGLALVPGGNSELGVSFTPCPEDIIIIETILEESVLIDNQLFAEILEYCNSIENDRINFGNLKWPLRIFNKLIKTPRKLWVADLFWSSFEQVNCSLSANGDLDINVLHDLNILGLTKDATLAELTKAYSESRAWRWLEGKLIAEEDKSMQFGRISDELHNNLLDEPAPYRKDVKMLVQNLFTWSVELMAERIAVDIPGKYSHRIRLLS